MNVEELLRNGLRHQADQAGVIEGLLDSALIAGRRRQVVRRTAVASGSAIAAAAVVATSVVVAHDAGGRSATVIPLAGGASPTDTPWWQTWTTGRHDGPISQTFLAAARPSYDGDTTPESITVYATGTTPDGTQWVMFTDPHDGHVMQWLQGWDNQPDVGESTQSITPDISWTSWSTPTLAAHNSTTGVDQQWLIVVGQPGTTSIEYSPDGTTWQPMDVQQGIGVVKIPTGFPPASAEVRLSNASGVYATGTPAGAGAGKADTDQGGTDPTGSPSALSTPTPTPTTGTSEPPSVAPSSPIEPTPSGLVSTTP